MQQFDPTTPILETQERVITDNLMKYHEKLQLGGRVICCFDRNDQQDIPMEDMLTINCKAINLLELNENNCVLDSGCIYANKEADRNGEIILTLGLEGVYIQSNGETKSGLIYLSQRENEPCRQFKIFRDDNIEGEFVKREIPVNEKSADFMILLMHVLGEHNHPLKMEGDVAKKLLQARITNLESKLRLGTEVTYGYNDDYDLKVVRNRFGEIVIDLVNRKGSNTREYDYRIRRFKDTYIFNSFDAYTLEGKGLVIPRMDKHLLGIYSQMILVALNRQQI